MTFLRFFTVYGPWGRPDMALFLFVKNICKRKTDKCLQLRKTQETSYVDDIVDGITSLINKFLMEKKLELKI